MATRKSTHHARKAACLAAVVVVLLGAPLVAGCSTNVGEVPFPAVHDMPPTRINPTLSDAEQKKAEQDLTTARDSVEARAQRDAQAAAQSGSQQADALAGAPSAGATAPGAARKGAGQQTGGSRNP